LYFYYFIKKIASIQTSSADQEGTSSTGEQRKPLVLLPRTLPTNSTLDPSQQTSSKATSIFGTGKPRDITKPEIKQLEEKVEKILTLQNKPSHVHSHSESSNASANGGGSSTGNAYKEDRLRTTSTTSSNNSNHK
jgi:hypothetical protein